jgi:transposase
VEGRLASGWGGCLGQQRRGGAQAAPQPRPAPAGHRRFAAGAARAGLPDESVDVAASRLVDQGFDGSELSFRACLAFAARAPFQLSATDPPRAGAGRSEDRALETLRLAKPKKKAAREGRTIVFLDESGLSTRPHRVRTWAPRGQTPVLQETFGWKSLSVIAGITLWNFYFQIHPGAIKSPQVIEFLKTLLRHLQVPLLILWDGAAIHRSKLVKEFVATTQGRLEIAALPAYAPELNPVEYLWAHLKEHEIGNLIVRHAWELSRDATAALRRMRRRPKIILACFAQAELWP